MLALADVELIADIKIDYRGKGKLLVELIRDAKQLQLPEKTANGKSILVFNPIPENGFGTYDSKLPRCNRKTSSRLKR